MPLLDGPLHWSLTGVAEALPAMLLGAESPLSRGLSERGWSHRWLDLRWTDGGLAAAGGRLVSWTPQDKGGQVDVVDDFREAPGAAAGGLDTVRLLVGEGPLRAVNGWERTLETRDDLGRTRVVHHETGATRGRAAERRGTAGGAVPLEARSLLTDHSLALHLWGLASAGELGLHVTDALVGLEQHVASARLAPCGKQVFGAGAVTLRGWRWTGPGLLPVHGWVDENNVPIMISELDRLWLIQDLLPKDHPLRRETA